jgi:AcrR family transcriptional regulator
MPAATPDRALPGRQREARSNDAAVFAAAREVFTAQGYGASIADVARVAHVGVGSIYRRYPTKQSLIEALQLHAVRDASELVREVADEFDAGPAIADPDRDERSGAVAEFLTRQITGATGPVLRPPGAEGTLSPELAEASEDLRVGLDRLITRDRAAGLLPEGFTTADVMLLLVHLRPPLPLERTRADALHLRYLDLILRGLHQVTGTGATLDDRAHWEEWLGTWHG